MAISTPLDVGLANADYIEELYKEFRANPAAMDAQWAAFFGGIESGGNGEVAAALARMNGCRSGLRSQTSSMPTANSGILRPPSTLSGTSGRSIRFWPFLSMA